MLLLILLMLAPQAETPRAEAERLFVLGNTLMSEGDARGAAAAYEGVLDTGWTSPELELNLSRAYLDADQLGPAVLHVERAQRLAPRHEAVAHNLRLVREHVGASAAPPSPNEAAARWLSTHVGAGGMMAMLLVVYLAVLGLVGFRLWKGETRPWLRRALVVLVPIALVAAAAALLTARYEAAPRAVVLVDAEVRGTPSDMAPTVEEVAEGMVLPITDERGLWRAVRLPDGDEGWIEASALEEI